MYSPQSVYSALKLPHTFNCFGTTPHTGVWFKITHIYHTVTGGKETYDYIRTKYAIKWETKFSNKIGQVALGVVNSMKSGNENIYFIPINKVPSEKNITYENQYAIIAHTKITPIAQD